MFGYCTDKKSIGIIHDILCEQTVPSPVLGSFFSLNLHDIDDEESQILFKNKKPLILQMVLGEEIESPFPRDENGKPITDDSTPRIRYSYFKMTENWSYYGSKDMKEKFINWFVYMERKRQRDDVYSMIWNHIPHYLIALITGGFTLGGVYLAMDNTSYNEFLPIMTLKERIIYEVCMEEKSDKFVCMRDTVNKLASDSLQEDKNSDCVKSTKVETDCANIGTRTNKEIEKHLRDSLGQLTAIP